MIIEPRSLMREALASLMVSHSFRMIGNMASAADIDKFSTTGAAPRLVILSALPVDEVASVARHSRGLWPEAKVVLLFERASLGDFQKVLASDIDGCIPVSASPDTLVDTLQRIIAAGPPDLCHEDRTMFVDVIPDDDRRGRRNRSPVTR